MEYLQEACMPYWEALGMLLLSMFIGGGLALLIAEIKGRLR